MTRLTIADLPEMPEGKNFEINASHSDQYGNIYPLVGYQYLAQSRYQKVLIDALRARLALALQTLGDAQQNLQGLNTVTLLVRNDMAEVIAACKVPE